ncbi:MAG: flippase-like domain-containing protein [Chthoniobacterales bacterium]|nr:flippase-like domain-containing protein [Chthoniobacterales bacterium]
MWKTLQKANLFWFIPGLVSFGIATVLQTWRWQWLLAVHNIRPSFRRTYGMNLIGLFFNLFLPGGTGGDLVKMYYASREAPGRRAAAVLSVFMDRVVGLLALIAIAAVVGLFAFREFWDQPSLHGLVISLGLIVFGALGFLFFVFVVDRFHLAKRLPRWFPLRGLVVEFATSFSSYARSQRALWASFLVSLPAHCLLFYSFYCASQALTDQVTLAQIFLVQPIVQTISAMPISVAGLGVREHLFKATLGALFGVPGAIAVLIGFTGFMLTVAWGAIGGLIYIFYRPSEHGAVSVLEMEREMIELEEKLVESQDADENAICNSNGKKDSCFKDN